MKNKIIYIAGNGRSGSTLLELLLNNFNKVFTLGEAQFAFRVWAGRKKNLRRGCGCGKSFADCDFWSALRQEVFFKKEEDIQTFSGVRTKMGYLRAVLGARTATPDKVSFCYQNNIFFKKAFKEAEDRRGNKIKYLVDASKGVRRLEALMDCDNIELYVIHLTRDPRGYVDSLTKNMKKEWKKPLRAFRHSIIYTLKNRKCRQLTEALPDERKTLVRYEDFAREPEAEMKRLAEWLGLKYYDGLVSTFRDRPNHGFYGNDSRWRDDGIKFREAWRTRLPRSAKFITALISGLWSRKYGYFKRE